MITSINSINGLMTSTLESIEPQSIRLPNTMCRIQGQTASELKPVIKWESRGYVLSQPMVSPLTDTNDDGIINTSDDLVIVYPHYSCSGSPVYVIDGKTGSPLWNTDPNAPRVSGGSNVAIADLEGDGIPEIIGMTSDGGTVVFDNIGNVKWTSDYPNARTGCNNRASITIADLDGDGFSEVLNSGAVLEYNGVLRFDHSSSSELDTIDVVVDINGDGFQEVLTGTSAYDYNGNKVFDLPNGDVARTFAVLNIDQDNNPEFAYITRTKVVLIDDNGELLWEKPYSSTHKTPLTVGDIDLDGNVEILGLIGHKIRVLNGATGEEIWAQPVRDRSHQTGLTLFDFEGDGKVEVVYNDEYYLRVYDGETGEVIYEIANRSHTATDAPIIVDIDGDGHAEIVIAGNSGIKVIEDFNDSWIGTRGIWNQYAYNIDNINNDLSVPTHPDKSWLTHNTYRLNTFPDRHPLGLVDLAIYDLHLDAADPNKINVLVYNRGLTASDVQSSINIYNDNPDQNGVLIGTLTVPILSAGEKITLSLNLLDSNLVLTKLFATIDENHIVTECDDENNSTSSAVFEVKASDPDGLFDTQRFTVVVENINESPVIMTAALPNAHSGILYETQIEAEDPDLGDALSYQLMDAPEGMLINNVTGVISWIPENSQSGDHSLTVIVKDLYGIFVTQNYTILVIINNAPVITSTPVSIIDEYQIYQYDVDATDLDNDILRYELDLFSQPANIESSTGEMLINLSSLPTSSLRASNKYCRITPVNRETIPFEPKVKWTWGRRNSLSMPLVAPLFDDNNDGTINTDDTSLVIVNSFTGSIDGAAGKLIALDGVTGEEVWEQQTILDGQTIDTRASSTPAIGDLDGDGIPEIVAYTRSGKVAAYDNFGVPIWISQDSLTYNTYNYGSISLYDIDGDGKSEILARNMVLNFDGSTRWVSSYGEAGNHRAGSYAIDTNGDGFLEIVMGDSIFDNVGNLLSSISGSGNANVNTSVGNFDDDDLPEFVAVISTRSGHPRVQLLGSDWSLIWEVEAIGIGRGGPPVISNLDGKGLPEISFIGAYGHIAFDAQGNELWRVATRDTSTGSNGSVSFDFDGDGTHEIVSQDQEFLRVIDGTTGEVVFIQAMNSLTAAESPIVADVDGNGHADIVVNGRFEDGSTVVVFQDINDRWVDTRKIWNQYWYHIDNINDDMSIPTQMKKGWLTHNTYRLNTFPDHHPLGLIDLAVFDLHIDQTDNTKINVLVQNRGLGSMENETNVNIYNGDPNQGGSLLGSLTVPILIASEQKVLTLENINPEDINQTLYAVIDERNTIQECLDDNNSTASALFQVRVIDTHNLSDTQKFTVTVENINESPSIITSSLAVATALNVYTSSIITQDPDNGDALLYQLVEAPVGLSIDELSGDIFWIPNNTQVGSHSVTIVVTDLMGLTATQSYVLSVIEGELNQNPFITSSPSGNAVVQQLYNYDVEAFDADGDILTYSLVSEPAGMIINEVNGIINWTPTDSHIGNYQITVRVEDDLGGFTTQSYLLTVSNGSSTNSMPIINSSPAFSAFIDSEYAYIVQASDADGDSLTYSLVQSPTGMTVSNTGLILWTPDVEQSVFVTIRVADASSYIQQTWSINVQPENITNNAPEITSTPPADGVINQAYIYDVDATDVDADILTYVLITSPVGMSIVPTSGVINWTPNTSQYGLNDIVIRVEDGQGGIATQSYGVFVSNGTTTNAAPMISSFPVLITKANFQYIYQLLASDADGDNLTYSLTESPAGMTVSSNGLIEWIPDIEQTVNIIIRVSDGMSYIEQSWILNVIAADALLSANIIISPQSIVEGDTITIQIVPINAIEPIELILLIDGVSVTIDENYQAKIIADGLGEHLIEVTLTDAYGTVTENSSFIVVDPSVAAPPEIDIISPTDGGIATGFVDISAIVQDSNLAEWRLSYRDGNDPVGIVPRTIIAQGTNEVNDEVIATWDTSLLRNGIYVLVLEAIDTLGNSSNIANSIFLEGDLKIGHFQLAFEDLNIPVAGIPVTISRSYDTRDRNSDKAFGKGWSIGYQALELTESRIPGLGWYQQTEHYSIGSVRLPRYCIESIGDRLVSVRMPDGGLEKFKVKAKTLNPTSEQRGNCQDIVPPDAFTIEFIPQNDTTSTLRAEGDSSNYRVRNGNIQLLADLGTYDPNKYKLTLLDGTIYQIDQGFNLTEIETTDGNSIKFTHNGIEHNNGYSVEFIRDTQDRITSIIKPNGDSIEYTYNTQGDLESHTDLMGNTTQFTYLLDHYLEDIIDPRGIIVARNEYDADGRLVAHIDANGNRIEYTHDISGRTETIKDRNGNSSIFVYDNAGSVIAETNALGETTYHEYNNYRLETKRIDPLGNETSWTYDQQGNQLTETDALGNTTTNTYTQRGELLTQTDPDGNITITNEYNDANAFNGAGQLNKVTDVLGNSSQFHWLTGSSGFQQQVTVSTGITDAKGNKYILEPIASGGTNDGLTGSITDLNGLKTESIYDEDSRPLTITRIITDSNGNTLQELVKTIEYDANGNVVKTIDELGNESRTEYNSINQISAIIDSTGNRIEYEYDDKGNQYLVRYPDGATTIKVYDAEGNVISSTDKAGQITKTIYDAANRVIEVILPDSTPLDDSDNPRTINTYDGNGQMTSSTNALGFTTQYEFDALGKQTKITNALGNETNSIYNSKGQKSQSIDSLGRIIKYEYSLKGNLIKTIFPDDTPNDDTDNLFTSIVYDELNRKISQTDLAGRITQYEYSKSGDLLAVIDSLNQRTEYTYDQRGLKLTQKDAEGQITSWAYDDLSRVVSRTLPEGMSESFTYNSYGNKTSRTDFNGDTTTYEYNSLNQQIKVTYADNTTVSSTYTALTEQIASITQAQGTTTYHYDEQERLTRIDYPTGNFIAYEYDKNDNRTLVQTGSQIISYTFDALNRLETVADTNGITRYSYDAVGNRATQTNTNGTVATYQYDDLNRLIDLTHTDSSSNIIANYDYTLGANGNRLSIEEATGRIVDYSYDDLYRLITEEITDPINGNHSSEFAYDAVGNRLQQLVDGVITTYSHNANDQILSETENGIETTYIYDNNGNTLSKSVAGVLDTSYSYNKINKLVQATTPLSTMTYLYDAGGIKQSQSVDGITTNFLIDPNRDYAQVLEEQDGANTVQVTYVYGDDLIKQKRIGDVHTYQYDGLGSTRVLTDESGIVQNSYGYLAFGEEDYQLGSVPNSYLFTGEQYDNNIGFYYLRARFYNPQIGSFLTMDTFPGMQFEPATLHKYLYTANNPINLTDPSGKSFLGGLLATIRIAGILGTSYATGSIIGSILSGNFREPVKQIIEEVFWSKIGYWRPVARFSSWVGTKVKNLFGKIWSRGKVYRLGEAGNSTALRHNLLQNGIHPIEGWQAHHIVGGAYDEGRQARRIIEHHKIDVNSATNGVYLPGCKMAAVDFTETIHCGKHKRDYERMILGLIRDAGGKSARKSDIVNILQQVREELVNGTLRLNKR